MLQLCIHPHLLPVGILWVIHLCVLQVQGWSHADVSIENILMTDNSEGKKTFKLIDYGMATKIGEAFSCHSTRLLTCASSQLQSEYAAAEDDVESLMYVLLSLAGLVLPWANIATSGNKAAVSLSLLTKVAQHNT